MDKGKAAYYRRCEPGIEGEKKAYEAESDMLQFENQRRHMCGSGGRDRDAGELMDEQAKRVFGQ